MGKARLTLGLFKILCKKYGHLTPDSKQVTLMKVPKKVTEAYDFVSNEANSGTYLFSSNKPVKNA